jgi:hypothetical protein
MTSPPAPPRRVYLAMWSGPRNISTALMRSWGSRADTAVVDEPLYAHYLANSPYRDQHPGADEVMAAYETDWRRVALALTGDIPQGRAIFYQKHMTHHLLPHIDLAWTDALTNCFLIREPGEMLVSLDKVIPDPELDQTGLPQQWALFERARQRTGSIPPVIDAADVLQDPRRVLSLLCQAVGVPFDEAMLSWPTGRRATDGIWAKYWYEAVENSTGFAPYQPRTEPIPARLRDRWQACHDIYQRLYHHRLR